MGEHNVPVALTSLIGREPDLRGIGEALRRARLVTVTGPGGVGKTRLAIEFARSQVDRHQDGVWFVDLALGAELPDAAAETARTLDVRGSGETTPIAALRAYLADRDALLVLDNCEHVADACAALAQALLGSCPHARIVATSRESLGVGGETVWRLGPLDRDDARRLFVERARQRRPDFVPTSEADATIGQLCDRLDRLPLAIEIAAARVSVMSPQEILAGLKTRLGLLESDARLAPARHRTVTAAVDWSYNLLVPAEQEALRSLSVLVGSFDADAAEAVGAGLSFDVLARLVDKSLVVAAHRERGVTRYRLLEMVRGYAHGRLRDADELSAARDRHRGHYVQLADAGPDGWPSPEAERLVAELAEDYENIRAALEWGAQTDPCAARASLFAARDLFFLVGQSDGRRLAELLLERCPARDRSRVETQITAGLMAMMTADIETARATSSAAGALAAELGESRLEGWAAFFHGLTDTLGGKFEDARARLEEARALHQRHGVRIGEGLASAALGLGASLTGHSDRGMELLETALAIQVDEDYHWGLGQAYVYLAIVSEANAAAPERVTRYSRAAVKSLRRYRESSLLPVALTAQASTIVSKDPERALKVVAAAAASRKRIGGGYPPVFRALVDRVTTAAQAAAGPDSARISSEGSRLGVDDAVALAFGTRRAHAADTGALSTREFEIASLVAEGMANKAIAACLHLSVRTVESHVRHALTKLALDNRTQLATWARERIQ